MRETFVIAKRELLERVRTKWFVVITILGPILLVGLIVIPALLAGSGSKGAKVDIVDETGKVGPLLATRLTQLAEWKCTIVEPTTTDEQERAKIRKKEIAGFIHVPKDGLAQGSTVYKGDNATNQMVAAVLQQAVPLAIIEARGVSVETLQTPKVIRLHTNGETEGQSGEGTFLLGYIIAFILYMVITLYGVNVMRSVVTEKSSRVVELLVAAAKPRALMAGKILGVGGAGLAQLLIWLVVGAIALANRDAILGAFHLHGGPSMLPSLEPEQIGIVLAFFIGGYVFYSALFAAVGATISSEEDTQQAQMPITMVLMIAIISLQAVTSDPRGSTAQTMSMVPCWSPILMPLRYFLGGASGTDVALSLGILVASTVLIARAAAKIFRVGILMYGKRPGLRELVRWLRY